ncbi:acyl-CoA thioester hydrolase/BAAT C-terminal domain-containing protein [Microbacterium sp. 2216-1]|uniref:acyl-CoA thioester hydrolase/BAAT C-terminal domain-containing protein n=1 Tax=Microbacterium sp. 2216-1 TaxID=3390053 RepID=UPI00397706FB
MSYISTSDRHDAVPTAPVGTAVLLLAGSSGRIETERADLLAAHGARVRAIRWFGGRDQRPAPHEVPVEVFLGQLAELRHDSDRVAVFGTSFGAEAALVTASLTPVDAVIAAAPTPVIWSGWHDGVWSSHWTRHGLALPAVPFDAGWTPTTDPPEYRGLYASSLDRHPAEAAAARIPVEHIAGEVVLIAGGDDRVWPSKAFAARIRSARDAAALRTTTVHHPDAGHRMVLPGETATVGGVRMARGGSPAADAALGAMAWPEIRRVLSLHEAAATR